MGLINRLITNSVNRKFDRARKNYERLSNCVWNKYQLAVKLKKPNLIKFTDKDELMTYFGVGIRPNEVEIIEMLSDPYIDQELAFPIATDDTIIVYCKLHYGNIKAKLLELQY